MARAKVRYDLGVGVPRPLGHGMSAVLKSMPKDGSMFFECDQTKHTRIASMVSYVHKTTNLRFTCRREFCEGVEGFRVYRLEDKEK